MVVSYLTQSTAERHGEFLTGGVLGKCGDHRILEVKVSGCI
jgi:hypothetical protein